MTNVTPINHGPVASTPATPATPATATDHADAHLADIARDIALSTLETMQHEGGDAADCAVRVLLLAVVELSRDINIWKHERALSDMLMHAVLEALDAYAEPIVTAGDAARDAKAVRLLSPEETRARLRTACLAGLRQDAPPPATVIGGDAEPLRVPRGGVELARAWLKACAPPPRPADDDTPPPAAA